MRATLDDPEFRARSPTPIFPLFPEIPPGRSRKIPEDLDFIASAPFRIFRIVPRRTGAHIPSARNNQFAAAQEAAPPNSGNERRRQPHFPEITGGGANRSKIAVRLHAPAPEVTGGDYVTRTFAKSPARSYRGAFCTCHSLQSENRVRMQAEQFPEIQDHGSGEFRKSLRGLEKNRYNPCWTAFADIRGISKRNAQASHVDRQASRRCSWT